VYLYTNGVVDIKNMEGHLYGNERLKAYVQKVHGLSAHDITENCLRDVHEFAAGAPQSDDIAILVLKYAGAQDHDINILHHLTT
jgi:sigma-B regulation protein RsbU (phosphoserine phosphatase)